MSSTQYLKFCFACDQLFKYCEHFHLPISVFGRKYLRALKFSKEVMRTKPYNNKSQNKVRKKDFFFQNSLSSSRLTKSVERFPNQLIRSFLALFAYLTSLINRDLFPWSII